jgi:hypothetical protein
MEFVLRSGPNDYKYKNAYLRKNASEIENLFLGSSHCYYGINPELIQGNSFNASHISQSIDYDFYIFEKYQEHWNNLKYIVIPIDYFTLFNRISNGEEKWRIKNYEIYYNINKSYKISDHSELLSFKFATNAKRIYDQLRSETSSSITCSSLGYGNTLRKQKDLESSGIIAAKRHTITDDTFLQHNMSIVKRFVEYVENHDVQLIFYTSPAYKSYSMNLNQQQLLTTIETIEDLTRRCSNCLYYNFLDDDDFNAADFRDGDHLNQKGAEKFSIKINAILKKLEHASSESENGRTVR